MKRLIVLIIAMSSLFGVVKTNAQVTVGVSVGIAPPALPVYEQPPCPGDGYLWTPGYWAWGPDGYYWVPGVWVIAPEVGFLWTPGYWGFVDGHYWWHGGYWGPHIGFYGGVCYGYGYWGHGFYGGRWEGGRFAYNTAIWHVGGGVHNTYIDRTTIVNNGNRTSFNGRGGVEAEPSAEERTAMNEHHVQPTSAQMSHEHSASANRNQLATVNHGNPRTTARSTVGGARFNSAGHAMAAPNRAATANRGPANNAAMHPANAPRPQAAPQQHPAMQNRPAPQQQRMAQQHPAMQRAPQGGGRAMGGGGERGRR
jgi:hypothetical protein